MPANSKIFIASKDVAKEIQGTTLDTTKDHLYLVYDTDGNLNTTNDQKIIRGQPERDQFGNFGKIKLEIDFNISASRDALGSDTVANRNYTELGLGGATADRAWENLKSVANGLAALDINGKAIKDAEGRTLTTADYYFWGPNSNATIGTILQQAVGINVFDQLPRLGGTGDRMSSATFMGLVDYFTSGTAPQTITLTDPRVKSYTDGNNGATTFQIGPSYLQSPHYNGQPIRLIADNNAASLDKIVLNGFNPSDILARRMTDGSLRLFFKDPATGELKALVDVPNAFDGIAGNDFNSLDVIAPNGTLTKIPLSNLGLDAFPLNYIVEPGTLGLTPLPSNLIDLPTWLTGGVGPGYAAGEGALLPRWGYGGGPGCPLVLDLDGDGVETVKLGFEAASRSNVYFDLNNDGVRERTAWVGKDDGLLALDRNNNGKIDNKSELFGNNGNFLDGFAQLRTLDTNNDGKITSADTSFSLLRVWKDANSNGITDTGELVTLASLNITGIALNALVLTDTYNNENWVSHRASYQLANGIIRSIEDVWFRFDGADTVRADAPTKIRSICRPANSTTSCAA